MGGWCSCNNPINPPRDHETPMSDNPELDRWNERFAKSAYHFGTAPNAFLASQSSRLQPGTRALSIADGEGRNGVWLAEHGLAVTAFDFSPLGVDKARKLAAARGVEVDYHVADIRKWNWDPDAFDVVAAIFFQFAKPDERKRIFAGIQRTLKPGGLVILQGYRPEQLKYGTGGPPWPEHLYTEALLRESFSDMEIVHLLAHDDEVHEGTGHDGMSALIDMVARKPPGIG
jgi:SAM-dependent methyltransferase